MKTATQCLLTYLQRVLVLLLLVFSSVHALADPPVAQDDSLSIQEDQVVIVEVLANDSDPDGDPLSITIISQSAFGTSVVLNGDSIEYTPDLDFFGNDTVVYRVCDGNGECDTAQLVITVTGENDFPIAMDDFALTSEDVVITFNVLGNDEEPDGEAVTVSIVSGPANGFAAIVLDSIVYTPALNFSGSDTVFYAICDTSLLCDTAMLVINITTTNDAPLALNDTASTTEDSAIVADVQANDSDPDGDPLTTTVIVPPSLAAATVMNGDSISYMPDLNATGNDSLAYRVCDGNGGCDTAWLYVTISAVNDAPLGTADNAATAEETTVVIDVQANDSDPENDVMTTTVSGLPSNGAAAVLNGDSLQYTPDADFFGFDTLQYAVCDPAMLCDTVEVIIAVTNVQDAPVAVTDSITTVEDSVVIIDVQANDSDADGDILFTSIITPPTSGTAVVIAGDSVLYTSLATGAGLDSFQYEVCDGSSLCAQAWVYINITGVNDAPIAIDDFTLTPEDSAIVVDVQANDLDPDGDTLTTTIVAGPSNGLAVVLNGNSIQYTPDTAFQGFDTIIYSVCDTGGLCDTAMLVIRVNDLDLSPIANNDNAVVLEDSSVVIDVQANDFDPVGLMMVTAVTGAPSNGTATVINLDSILYTPDPDFVGTDTFFYSACNPICDTARVIVTVLQVNDPPVAMNDTVTTGENIAITIDVQANDSDIEGNTLTTTVVVQPGMGVATVLNGDSLGYVPNTNINGDDSLQYRVCDGNGGCDSAWVYINISAVNNAPVAQADFGFTDEETALTIDVQLNDLDPDGDTLLTTVITAPVNGAASVLGSDSISYTPDVDFFGFDTLTYSVCDTGGLCDTATVVIEVGGLNDAPIALTDSATTDEEVTIVIDIQANDTDADGNTLVTNIITPAANGMATVVNGDSISYTPGLNFYGWDSLTYEVCDGNGGCGQASVYINVLLLADAPVAGDDFYTLDEDSVMLLDVQANDFDADSDSIVTTAIVTLPLNGTTLIVNGDSITYTPDSNYNGTDSFAYSLCDTTGLCDTAMVFLTITAINDAPLAVDDSATTPEDIAVNVDVQLNDSDADGDPFTTVVVAAAANGTAQVVGGVSITYTPDTGYSGTDSVGYEICDGSGACAQATLYITILSVNDPPVAAGDSATTMEEVAVTIDVQANDTDPENDSLITTAIVSAPANGSATILGGDSISYDPDVDFFGTDVFTYAVCDTGGLCDTAIVVVTVLNIDDTLLVAVDDSVTAQEEILLTIDVQANDTNPDNDSTYIITAAANGTVTLLNGDSVSYVSDLNYNGPDSFAYALCDTAGNCDTAMVFITVMGVNDAPLAMDDSVTTSEDTAAWVTVLANDIDADGDSLILSIITPPANGVANLFGSDSILYDPDTNYNGPDSFMYSVCDTAGLCDSAMVFILIDAVNDAPLAVDDSVIALEDSIAVIYVLNNDTNVDGDSTFISIVVAPLNGTAVIAGDSITYEADSNYIGPDSFAYSLCDTAGLCDTAWVYLEVMPFNNDFPLAVDDSVTVPEDSSVVIDVQANDINVDGDSLITTVVTLPMNGTVTILGADSVLYEPDTNYNGPDSFMYSVCDTAGLCDTAMVFIEVLSVDDTIFIAVDDSLFIAEDSTAVIDVQGNDINPDSDSLITSIITPPANGTATVLNGDSISYTPDLNYNGPDTIVYALCDTSGTCDTAIVYITIDPVNDAPVAMNDFGTTPEDTAIVIDVLDNDTDVDGDSLITTAIVTAPANGTATILSGDSIMYTPDTNYNGFDSVMYSVCDTGGLCDTAWVFIEILPVDDTLFFAVDDSITTMEDSMTVIDVQANDINPDNDSLITSVITPPVNGTATVLGGDSISYTPDSNYNGLDSFAYTLCDTAGTCDTAVVYITIDPVNDAPLAMNDSITTAEDTAVVFDVLGNDSDVDGDSLITTAIVNAPSNGTATILAGDSIMYEPDTNYNGLDSFMYSVCDTAGLCDTAWVFIDIFPVDDTLFFAVNDSITTMEDSMTVIDVQANDINPDNDSLITSVITPPANGTTTVLGGDSISYTPDSNYNGLDSFAYALCDTAGTCDTAMVYITIDPVNDAPFAVDDSVVVLEDSMVVIQVLDNDTNVDGDSTIVSIAVTPLNGTAVVTGDSITYTPDSNYTGLDSFAYSLCDTAGLCDTAWAYILVLPFNNDFPLAVDDSVTVPEDSSVVIDVQANDINVDADSLITTIATAPLNGTATLLGADSVLYAPDTNYNGLDSFMYSVCDTAGLCDTAWVYIDVLPVDDTLFFAVDDSITITEDSTVMIDVQANDINPDNDSLITSIVMTPANGTATVLNGDSITYDPDTNYNGLDSFAYALCDTAGVCDTAMVYITIDPVNDAPVAVNDSATVMEDSTVVIDVLANDTDVEGDSLITTIATAPLNGTATVLGGDSIMYAPDTNYNGLDSFMYSVCDTAGLCDTAWVYIDVLPVDDTLFFAVDDSITIMEDSTVMIDVQANDINPDNDSLITSIVMAPVNGTATVLNGDSIIYDPDTNYNGLDSFAYALCDTAGVCDTAMVYITIDPVNDAPVAVNDSATVMEDSTVVIDVLANDTDVEGDSLITTIATAPVNGTATLLGADSVLYEPDTNYNGLDSFMYSVCDTAGLCDTAWVYIDVLPVDDTLFFAVDDSITIMEDSTVMIDVQANDINPDNDSLITSIVMAPANGTATVLNGDSITYDPDTNYNGLDSFAYALCDTAGVCDTAMVYITIDPVNDAPVAVNDSATVMEDSTVVIDVLANDTDVEADSLITSAIVTAPVNGTATILGGDSIMYAPDTNYNGLDSFMYSVCDTAGLCDTAWVYIDVLPVDDTVFVAVDDSITIMEDSTAMIDVQANDINPDNDSLITSIVMAPANGTATVLNGDSITYDPDTNYNGLDSFAYALCDTAGVCDTAMVYITIDPVNDAPVAVNDSATVMEDSTVVIDVLANDTDVEGDSLITTAIVMAPVNGTATVLNADSVSYEPDTNFNGLDSFMYSVCDTGGMCDTAWVYINVLPVDDSLLVAVDDSVTTMEDISVTIDVQANDINPDNDSLITTIVTPPVNGTAAVLNADSVLYDPDTDYNGLDSFLYSICDTAGLCDTAWVYINILPVNDSMMVAVDDSATTMEDISVTIDVQANDSNLANDSLITAIVTAPVNGTATVLGGDSVLYDPDTNYNGLDSFLYSICDTAGLCDTAWVYIDVLPVDDSPIAVDDSATTMEDISVTIDVQANDTNPDNDSLITAIVTAPVNGTATVLGGDSVLYDPDTNYNGLDSFLYSICDTAGLCDTAWVYIDVLPVDDTLLVAVDDSATTMEDISVTIDVQANDTNPDNDSLITTIVTPPVNGTATVLGGDSVLYDPDANYNGLDSLLYSVCDTTGLCDTAWVYITIDPVNDAPVAVDDSATTDEDTPVIVDVQANDTDPENDSLITSIITPPVNGSVIILNSDSVRYDPDANYFGLDSFLYSVCDTSGLCDSAWVYITINPLDDAPVALNDSATTQENTPVTIDVQGNDSDPDNDSIITTVIVTPPVNGTANIVNGDSITYDPDAGFNGWDSLTYSLCDTTGLCDTAVVYILVEPLNNAPVAVNDFDTTAEDTPVTIDVQANDSDPDNDSIITMSIVFPPLNGTISILAGNQLSYFPDPDFNGTDALSYELCDTAGLCDTASVFIVVTPVADAPIARNDSATTDEQVPVVVDVQANDTDADNDQLITSAIITAPTGGTASIQAGNTIEYTPGVDFTGWDSLTYSLCDTTGLCDTAIVYIMVDSINDAPIAVDDSATAQNNQEVVINVTANDSDPEGDSLTVNQVTVAPLHGTATITSASEITYQPDSNYQGLDSLVYEVCDGNGGCDQATVYITVEVNLTPPLAVDDSATTLEEHTVSIDVLANDIDSSNTGLSISAITVNPQNGTAQVVNGMIDYTPDTDFSGQDQFQYRVCNQAGQCDEAVVYITVTEVSPLRIGSGFSPNGDGVNDFFVIPGIERYPNNTFTVFNRWGDVVFDKEGYLNEWDGKTNEGEPLPQGTYFYVLEIDDIDLVSRGYIDLRR